MQCGKIMKNFKFQILKKLQILLYVKFYQLNNYNATKQNILFNLK